MISIATCNIYNTYNIDSYFYSTYFIYVISKIKLKWNIKKYSNNPEKAWKGKQNKTRERTKTDYWTGTPESKHINYYIKCKWIIDLNINSKIIKISKNFEENLHDLRLGKEFSDIIPKTWDIVEIKKLCSLKDMVKKMKRQATEWERIFEIAYMTKDLYAEYIKKSQNNCEKTTQWSNE